MPKDKFDMVGRISKSYEKPVLGKTGWVIRQPQPQVIVQKLPGRNDKCPCGSGKKFKKCHINDVVIKETRMIR